eukprot:tig00021719_g23156.t1
MAEGPEGDGEVPQAAQCISIRLVGTERDLDVNTAGKRATTWTPKFVHQLVGEGERFEGYEGLRVELLFDANARLYLSARYESRAAGARPADVAAAFAEHLPLGFERSRDEFSRRAAEPWAPVGAKQHEYELPGGERFEVWKAETLLAGPGRALAQRLQLLGLLLIESWSHLELDDDRWSLFLLVNRGGRSSGGGVAPGPGPDYIAGFATAYKFFAYPDSWKLRVSQVVVLPPFQREGHGGRLLQCMYDDARALQHSEVVVEDPCPEFQRVRDRVDLRNVLGDDDGRAFFPEEGPERLEEGAAARLREELLLTRKQAVRVFEMVRLRRTNLADPDAYKRYRLLVKRRLDAETRATVAGGPAMGGEERKALLEGLYRELEGEYRAVLASLDKARR